MYSPLRTAAALILIAGGGLLIYQGFREYYTEKGAQKEAADAWRRLRPTPPSPEQLAPSKPQAPEAPKEWFIPQGAFFSRIEVPRFGIDLFAVEGSDEKSLKKGPGHVRGSAMPGNLGNCVIAGHRDTQFRPLKDVRVGDPIEVETTQGNFVYKVSGTQIVTPDRVEVMAPTPNATLTIITCYPFYFIGHAPKRFIISATLASPNVQELDASDRPLTPFEIGDRPNARSKLASSRENPRASGRPTGL